MPSQLLKHPADVPPGDRCPFRSLRRRHGQPLLLREAGPVRPSQGSEKGLGHLDPIRRHRRQIRVECLLHRVADLRLPPVHRRVDRCRGQLVRHQPGQQEGVLSLCRAALPSPEQMPGHHPCVHSLVHAAQPQPHVLPEIVQPLPLHLGIAEIDPRPLRRQRLHQPRAFLPARHVTRRHHDHGMRRQPCQQIVRDLERLAPRLVQAVHHQYRRRSPVLDRPLHLAHQLTGVTAGLPGGQ